MSKKFDVEHSSGNVFADLELENAEELLLRSELSMTIETIIKKRKLTQDQIVKILGISKKQLPLLKDHIKLAESPLEMLFNWIIKLGHNIKINIEPLTKKQQSNTGIFKFDNPYLPTRPDDRCPICAVMNKKEPNAETLAAIEEIKNGGGKTFSSVEEMLTEINNMTDDE